MRSANKSLNISDGTTHNSTWAAEHKSLLSFRSHDTDTILPTSHNSQAGFLIAVDDIPSFWTFMPAIDPVRYVFEALIIIQLECDDGPGSSSGPGCNMLDDANGTAWEVVQTNFGFESSQLWPNIGITIAFLFAFRIFTALGLAFVNHQKR